MRGQKGFTLTETLIVVAIISVLSAVALPFFYKWQTNAKYKQASWGIASGLRLGKQMALSTNREHRMEFDLDGRRYRTSRGNLPSGSTAWTGVNAWTALDAEVNWTGGTDCTGTADFDVIFRPNGSAETNVICINDTSNVNKYTVSINSTSGRAVIN